MSLIKGVWGNVGLLNYGGKGNMPKDWGKPCNEHFLDRAGDWTEPSRKQVTRHHGQFCIPHTCHIQLYRYTLWSAAGIHVGRHQHAGEMHQDFHVGLTLFHYVPVVYELIRVCKSIAGTEQNVLCVWGVCGGCVHVCVCLCVCEVGRRGERDRES